MPATTFRHTRIVATLGPACADEATLEAMLRAGMDVARLNTSHGTWPEHEALMRRVRTLAQRLDRPLAVLVDLPGPKMRVRLARPALDLVPGATVDFVPAVADAGADAFAGTEPTLIERLAVGVRLLLADGTMELEVAQQAGAGWRCRVLVGGRLTDKKGLNVPALAGDFPAFTAADRVLATQALAAGADLLALSFVGGAEDVEALRQLMDEQGRTVPVYAKMERPAALAHLHEILAAADGLLVARGDLGVEMALEEVPRAQKRLIDACNHWGKPVITATQMLESMVAAPRPTRAEVSDVANAIYDGTDAIMLSAETSAGQFPVDAVRTMDRVARATEHHLFDPANPKRPEPLLADRGDRRDALCFGAAQICRQLPVRLAVVSTFGGASVLRLAKNRTGVPILAVAEAAPTVGSMCVVAGVRPVHHPQVRSFAALEEFAARYAVAQGLAEPGDQVVYLYGEPFGADGTTDTIRLRPLRAPRGGCGG